MIESCYCTVRRSSSTQYSYSGLVQCSLTSELSPSQSLDFRQHVEKKPDYEVLLCLQCSRIVLLGSSGAPVHSGRGHPMYWSVLTWQANHVEQVKMLAGVAL